MANVQITTSFNQSTALNILSMLSQACHSRGAQHSLACCNLLVIYIDSLAHKSNFAGHVILTNWTVENTFSAPWFFSEMELEPAAG